MNFLKFQPASWTKKKFAWVLLIIVIGPAIVTLLFSAFTPLPKHFGDAGIDRTLSVASNVGTWASLAAALSAAVLLSRRIGCASAWRLLLSLFSIAIFFVVSLALCLGGCGLGDSLRR